MRISDWSSDVCSSDLPRSRSRSSHHMGLKLSLRQLITRRTREAMSADMPIEASDVPRPDSGGTAFRDQPAHVENGRLRSACYGEGFFESRRWLTANEKKFDRARHAMN